MLSPLRLAIGALLVIAALLSMPSTALAQAAWEIDTYGNGSMLRAVFEGISTFTGAGGGLRGALKLAGMIGLLALLFSMAGTALGGGHVTASFPYAAIVAGAVATLSTSTVNVAIVDKVAATSEIVQGIPLPIAIIGYFTSTVGSRITEQVEQVIQPVDYQRFMSKGLGWGPRVTQATLEAQIQDPILRQDLNMYIQVCVTYDFNTGYKTAKTLTQGKTVDEILGDTNAAIAFILPSQQQNPPANQTCPDAWTNVLSPTLTDHATSQDILGFMAMRLGLPSYSDVLPAITDVTPDLLKVSQSATELLKLRFVVNQLLPSVQAMSAAGGQSAMVTAWALAEAQAQQTSAWLTTGLLLQQVLPVFHAALEFLFYGFLLIGLPLLMVMPRMLIQIAQTALWLQLWPVAYVFGNLFLYTQVSQVSRITGETAQNLGMSLAATPAIQGSIESAYAASGFPIMIGVTMLGGMIFGGGYALQRAVMSGPWQAGGAFGSAAALGNISVGNATAEQRNLEGGTRQVGQDPLGRDAIVQTRGRMDAPTMTTFESAGGTTTIWGQQGSQDSSLDWSGPGRNALSVTASPQGIQAAGPMLDMTASRQNQEAVTTRYSQAKAQTAQSTQRLGVAVASGIDRTMRATEGVSEQAGFQEVNGLRETVSHDHSQAVERGLRKSNTYGEVQQQLDQKGVNVVGGVGFNRIISAGGTVEIFARDNQQKEHSVTLTGDDARRFSQDYHHQLAHDTNLQKSLHALESSAREKGLSINLSEVQQQQKEFSTAQREEQTASQQLDTVNTIGRLVQRKEIGDYLEHAWRARGEEQSLNNTLRDPSLRSEAIAFLEQQNEIINRGGQDLRDQLQSYATATSPKDAETVQHAIAEGTAGITGIAKDTIPQPPTLEGFRDRGYASDPREPHTTPVKDRVESSIKNAPVRIWADKADEGRRQAEHVPSTQKLEEDLERGKIEERTILGQSAQVVKQVGKDAIDTGKAAVEELKKAGERGDLSNVTP